MSYAAIRAALQTQLKGVSGMGNVYTYDRWTTDSIDSDSFQKLFVVNNIINAWSIVKTGDTEKVSADDETITVLRHQVSLVGVMSQIDANASQNTFEDLVEAVENSFRTSTRTLGGACHTYSLPQASRIERVMFGTSQVLCHRASLALQIEELIGATSSDDDLD